MYVFGSHPYVIKNKKLWKAVKGRKREEGMVTFLFQLTVSGEPGDPVASALRPVEEEINISRGAVTRLLRPEGGTIARGNILSTHPAT